MNARAVLLALVSLALSVVSPAVAKPFDPFAAIGLDGGAGAEMPADARFRDARGNAVRLGDYFAKRPLIVAPVYYRCPNVCGTTLSWLFGALDSLPQRPGRDYDLVVFSIDPSEAPADAAQARAKAGAASSALAGSDGVHFLVGSKDSVAALTGALGFRYQWDDDLKQYAHPVGVAVLTPSGRLSRWLYGFSYDADELTGALTEARGGDPHLSFGQQLLLLCHAYNPITGKYTGAVWTGFRIGGGLTVVGLIGLVGVSLARQRRKAARRSGAAS
jgi:protein SCO1/2